MRGNGPRTVATALLILVVSWSAADCSIMASGRGDEEVVTYSLSASTPDAGDTHPSAASIDYARRLGGTPQTDRRLWVILGRTGQTEDEAKQALSDALPFFGDMQTYFIVQHSDGFEGLPLGQWVVIEAYDNAPSSENLEFARRAFAGAEAVEVVVRTQDPIPVYEQIAGR